MRYDSYENKVEKVVKVRDFIVRFKIIFIAVIAVIFVAIGTLFGIKGIVTSTSLTADMTYTYGDEISLTANAFMGSAVIQYKAENSEEWVEETPYLPGTYSVRAASRNNFGSYYYSDETVITILAREINLTLNNEVTYGEVPNLEVDGLLDGDNFEYDVTYDDISKENPIASVSNFSIEDSEGKDVTSCYSFSLPNEVQMSMNPRTITISAYNENEEYDGLASLNEYKFGVDGLAEGDYLEETSVVAATDYSDSEIKTTFSNFIIKNKDGIDVSVHYKESNDYSVGYTLNKKTVEFVSNSFSKIYDGNAINASDLKLENEPELGEGDTYNLEFYLAKELPVEAGTYSNTFGMDYMADDGVEIVGSNKDNAEHYYNVIETPGTITIEKRPVTLSFNSKAMSFDEVYPNGFRVDASYFSDVSKDVSQGEDVGILDEEFGDYLEISYPQYSTDAAPLINDTGSYVFYPIIYGDEFPETSETLTEGEYYFEIHIWRDTDEGKKDVTKNYDITLEGGQGSITVSNTSGVSIQTKDLSKEYDGDAFSSSNFPTGVVKSDSSETSPIVVTGLPDNFYLYINSWANSGEYVAQTGVENNTCDYFIFYSSANAEYDETDDAILTDRFDVTEDWGDFSISKKPISISGDAEQTVDFSGYAQTPTLSVEGLATGDTATIVYGSEIIEDSLTYYFSETSGGNAITITITNESGEDVTNCYDLSSVYGSSITLNITQPTLVLESDNLTKTYDGTPLDINYGDMPTDNFRVTSSSGFAGDMTWSTVSDNSYAYSCENFIVVASDFSQQTNAGTSTNQVQANVFTKDYTDVTDYFDISWTYGDLTVSKKAISVVYNSDSYVYDGQSHGYSGASSDGLVDQSHGISVSTNGGPTDVSESGATPETEITITDGEGNDVTDNYEITGVTKPGIEITKRPAWIGVSSDSFSYDGTTHYPEYFYDGLIDGHEFTNVTYEVVESVDGSSDIQGVSNAGESKTYKVASYDIVDSSGASVKDNYEVDSDTMGMLVCSQANLTLTVNSSSKTYDGTALTPSQDGYKVTGLVGNDRIDSISVVLSGSQTDVGSSVATASLESLSILNEDNEEVTNDYTVTLVEGTLTVRPIQITLSTSDIEGEEGETISDSERGSVSGLPDGYTVSVTWDELPTTAGRYENSFVQSVRIFDDEGNDVTDNFNITGYNFGTATIYGNHAVTFYDDEGNYLYETSVRTYDYLTSYDGPTPTKAETDEYRYEFVGWSTTPGSSVADVVLPLEITGDTNLYAVFSASTKTIEITVSATSVEYSSGGIYTPNYEVTSGLPDGYGVSVYCNLTGMNDPGTVYYDESQLIYIVHDASGNIVNGVSVEFSGTFRFNIAFPEVDVTLTAKTVQYSGNVSYSRDYTASGLPTGYSMKFYTSFNGTTTYSVYNTSGAVVSASLYQGKINIVEDGGLNFTQRNSKINLGGCQVIVSSSSELSSKALTASSLENISLASGDRVSSVSYRYSLNGTTYTTPTIPDVAGTYVFKVWVESIKIVNSSGTDVTSYYSFSDLGENYASSFIVVHN